MTRDASDGLRAMVMRQRRGRRSRFPAGLREKVMAHARRRWAEGASLKAVSEEIGVSVHTLSYWRAVEREPRTSRIKRVQIVAAEPMQRMVWASGPHGLGVQLTLDEVAELLRKLA